MSEKGLAGWIADHIKPLDAPGLVP
jgi:hypothetical protein